MVASLPLLAQEDPLNEVILWYRVWYTFAGTAHLAADDLDDGGVLVRLRKHDVGHLPAMHAHYHARAPHPRHQLRHAQRRRVEQLHLPFSCRLVAV